MPRRKLDSYVSGQIARTNPLEGGPAFEAWQNGSSVMASTWGDYASRLVEKLPDGEDISLETILTKFCIDLDKFQDPSIHFGDAYGSKFSEYKTHFRNVTYKEVTEYYAPEVKRLQMILDAILEGYEVDNQAVADKRADELQNEIDAAYEEFRKLDNPTEEQEDNYTSEQIRLCMQRDALRSGVAIPLAKFVDNMLQVSLIHDEDFKSELAHVWVRSLESAFSDFYDKYDYASEMHVSKIVVGRDIFANMRSRLKSLQPEQEDHYNKRWQEVEPVFITNHIKEHPLITGIGEK
ncbi:hypothetical protein KC952_03215 [Candidatus Saccharibacteria bacterium]|nr:hypothetical protein [Candidatus Saccharibacteria bacterium]